MKKIIISINILVLSCSSNNGVIPEKEYNYDVTIHRDTWGVPHIYGNSDEDAAFGLAFAHAEDDFETIQEILIATRGRLATIKGKDGAPLDYLVGFLDIWNLVESNFDKLSPKIKNICKAYADGINRYIEKNPKELINNLYPVTNKDIIAGFALRTPLMFNLHVYIEKTMKKEKPNFSDLAIHKTDYSMYASNVFAVAPSRSDDGHTRIAINSHQPWTGPVTWYEAHIHSNEGWNIIGGLFPGSPVILKGHTENIAWSHTVNEPDLIDIYELTINPKNKNQYLFDGEWIDFRIKTHPIKVKILGPISWTFNQKLFWSKHGPVIKAKHGVYAFRYSGYDLIRQVEQWYQMNKATNLTEFKEAMKMMQIPMFNTLYADKTGNIFYLYNALLPKRKEGFDWHGILAGDNSNLIWNEYYSFEELPQSTNPESGYLQNCNSTPYLATVGQGNPEKILPDNTGIEDFQTNRAYRANELYGLDESITRDEFYVYKYDTYYSKDSGMYKVLNQFLKDVDTNDPELLEGLNLLRNWDFGNQKDNTGAALAQLTFKLTFNIDKLKYDYKETMERFKKGIKYLKKEFGRIDIPLGDMQILKRGGLELPLDGGPDVLRAIYTEMQDKRKVTLGGDCFFQIVDWDEDGNIVAESIHQFGSATLDENSPHYADQAKLFSNMDMKPSLTNLDEIKKNLKISYKP